MAISLRHMEMTQYYFVDATGRLKAADLVETKKEYAWLERVRTLLDN